jgi:hypothetical protein
MPMLSLTAPSLLEVLRRRVVEPPSFAFLDANGAEAEILDWGELDCPERAMKG